MLFLLCHTFYELLNLKSMLMCGQPRTIDHTLLYRAVFMSSCCPPPEPAEPSGCCGTETTKKSRPDILLWSTIVLVSIGYFVDLLLSSQLTSLSVVAGQLFAAIRDIMDSSI